MGPDLRDITRREGEFVDGQRRSADRSAPGNPEDSRRRLYGAGGDFREPQRRLAPPFLRSGAQSSGRVYSALDRDHGNAAALQIRSGDRRTENRYARPMDGKGNAKGSVDGRAFRSATPKTGRSRTRGARTGGMERTLGEIVRASSSFRNVQKSRIRSTPCAASRSFNNPA